MNKTGRGGISMRGGINPEYPFSQDQLNDVRLQSAMNILKVVAEYEGGERVAENAWNTIMNIACGDGTTERKPFDRDDVDVLAAARTVSPDAVLIVDNGEEHSLSWGTQFVYGSAQLPTTTSKKPVELADTSDLETLANLTSGELTRMVYGEDWMTEAEVDAQEFRDVKFGSKQWFDGAEEIPF